MLISYRDSSGELVKSSSPEKGTFISLSSECSGDGKSEVDIDISKAGFIMKESGRADLGQLATLLTSTTYARCSEGVDDLLFAIAGKKECKELNEFIECVSESSEEYAQTALDLVSVCDFISKHISDNAESYKEEHIKEFIRTVMETMSREDIDDDLAEIADNINTLTKELCVHLRDKGADIEDISYNIAKAAMYSLDTDLFLDSLAEITLTQENKEELFELSERLGYDEISAVLKDLSMPKTEDLTHTASRSRRF